jgi:hypothetical protein
MISHEMSAAVHVYVFVLVVWQTDSVVKQHSIVVAWTRLLSLLQTNTD